MIYLPVILFSGFPYHLIDKFRFWIEYIVDEAYVVIKLYLVEMM